MRNTFTLALIAATGLTLAACSEQTQDAAETTGESAANDVAGAADAAGAAAEQAANDAGAAAKRAADNAGQAIDKAAASTDEMGNKIEQKAAEVEADVHNESVTEAKRD